MKYIINSLVAILLIFILSALILTFLGYSFQTISDRDRLAMYPTLEEGDFLLSNSNYGKDDIRRGDVVIIKDFRFPYPIIRRVIGVEKDKIQIDNGKIFLNEKSLDEPYTSTLSIADSGKEVKNYFIKYQHETTVPDGDLYVSGDNRVNSYDSRDKDFGTISSKTITGKIVFILFSNNLSKIGTVL